MKHESNGRRREILSSISDLDFEAYVYRTRLGDQSERTARDACLRTMMSDLMALSVVRMVIETCDQDHHDNQLIRRLVGNEVARDGFDYLHSTPAVEPLLWLPDIAAWAFGRGGDWRRRAAALLAEVKDV